MGTITFLAFITAMLAGLFLFLSKTKSDSKEYLHGQKADSSFPQELLLARQTRESKLPRAEAYVDWYMRKLEDVRCEKERRKILAASSAKVQRTKKSGEKTADSDQIELGGLCHQLGSKPEAISISHSAH